MYPSPPATLDDGGGAHAVHWRLPFVGYLFLAFDMRTAFSPTDAPALARWARGLMMVQALLSFATVAVLAARAVIIL